MMWRRAMAITVLTGASLIFASRFHGPVAEPLLTAGEQAGSAGSTTTVGSSPATLAPSATTTTTIVLPDVIEGAVVYEGTRVHTNWGWTKVEISVLDGVMVDIEMVMVPHATKRSEALAEEYEPILRQQALERQSPRVDVIAGATVISNGYRISVAGAMKEAGLWPPPQG